MASSSRRCRPRRSPWQTKLNPSSTPISSARGWENSRDCRPESAFGCFGHANLGESDSSSQRPVILPRELPGHRERDRVSSRTRHQTLRGPDASPCRIRGRRRRTDGTQRVERLGCRPRDRTPRRHEREKEAQHLGARRGHQASMLISWSFRRDADLRAKDSPASEMHTPQGSRIRHEPHRCPSCALDVRQWQLGTKVWFGDPLRPSDGTPRLESMGFRITGSMVHSTDRHPDGASFILVSRCLLGPIPMADPRSRAMAVSPGAAAGGNDEDSAGALTGWRSSIPASPSRFGISWRSPGATPARALRIPVSTECTRATFPSDYAR